MEDIELLEVSPDVAEARARKMLFRLLTKEEQNRYTHTSMILEPVPGFPGLMFEIYCAFGNGFHLLLRDGSYYVDSCVLFSMMPSGWNHWQSYMMPPADAIITMLLFIRTAPKSVLQTVNWRSAGGFINPTQRILEAIQRGRL